MSVRSLAIVSLLIGCWGARIPSAVAFQPAPGWLVEGSALSPDAGRVRQEAAVPVDPQILPVGRLFEEHRNSWTDECCPASGEPSFTLRGDLRNFAPTLWRDTRGLLHTENGLILGVSLAAAIGIRQDLDGEVREYTAAHPLRWGDASRALGVLGEAPYQVPLLAAVWGYSVWRDDPRMHSLAETLVSAYTINGLATLLVKGVSDTDRPDADWNNGRWGFPSFHSSSTFTIAAVLDEYYGWRAGLPAYTLAGLISWSRIDERDHDLSDVVFGAAMGYVIGKSVADRHLGGTGRVRILPWRHPTEGTPGIALEMRF